MTDARIYVGCPREGYCLASIPALPGCVASGRTRDEAVANARRAWTAYLGLLETRGVSTDHWKGVAPDALPVSDAPEGGLFDEDTAPIEEHDLRDFLHVFEAQHAALTALVAGIPRDQLERPPGGEAWSIRQTLEHMMSTQASLLSRLEEWPDDPFNTLQAIHRIVFQRFTVMEPQDTEKRTVFDGRTWTVRRVMRRILEHEWEHYVHVQEILVKLGKARR